MHVLPEICLPIDRTDNRGYYHIRFDFGHLISLARLRKVKCINADRRWQLPTKVYLLACHGPFIQQCLHTSCRRSGSVSLPLLVLVAIRIVTDPLYDYAGESVPNSGTLHFEGYDVVSLCNIAAMLA